ncbi:MAG: hypothetical protein JWO79_2996 [Actinomycetia bacterium]|nr:hypothetical protein [Actinomycetes bacterium]
MPLRSRLALAALAAAAVAVVVPSWFSPAAAAGRPALPRAGLSAARSPVDLHTTPIPIGRWATSTLGTRAATDRFQFRVNSPGDFLLTLGGDPAPYRLVLRDAAGQVLAVSDRGGEAFEEVQQRLRRGRYVAELSSARPLRAGELARLLVRPVPRRLAILDSHRGSSDGVSTITGQLLNNSGAWRSEPRVTAHIVLAGGRPGGGYTALAGQSVLAPGQRGSFRIAAPPLPPGARYRLTVTAGWRGPAARTTVTPDEPFEVAGGLVRFTGQVTGRTAGAVHVHILRYNRIGALVDSGQAILALVPDIGPAHYTIDLPRYSYVSSEQIVTG